MFGIVVGVEDDAEPADGLPSIERSVWLPANTDVIWHHLTDGELLELWFGGEASIDPRAGGRLELRNAGGPDRWGTVEAIEPRSRIQWTWRTGTGDPSMVVISLGPEDGGTRLEVCETLLPYRMEYHEARIESGLR